MPTIAFGTRGKEVMEIQSRLHELRYLKDSPDGFYGPATRSAVRNIQGRHGLPVTGDVDEQTRTLLDSEYVLLCPAQTTEEIDAEEIDRHLAYLMRASEAPDAESRQRIVAEGFMEFGPRLLESVGRWLDYTRSALEDPETPEDVRAGIELKHEALDDLNHAGELLLDWLGGTSYSNRVDEPERRARVAVMVLDEMGFAALTRRATRAILALPEGHPDRDVDKARSALLAHLHRSRIIGASDEILFTISDIVSHHLLDPVETQRLIDEGAELAETIDELHDRRNFWMTVLGYYVLQAYTERDRIEATSGDRILLEPSAGEDADPVRLVAWRDRAEAVLKTIDTLSASLPDEDRQRVSMKNRLGLAMLYGLDQPAKAADILRKILEDGTLDEALLNQAARLEARVRLALDQPDRALDLLEPRLQAFEKVYLDALSESDVDQSGGRYHEVLSTLAFASVAVNRWDRVVDYLGRGRGLRLRHRTLLRRSPDGAQLIDLERQLYALSRGLHADSPIAPIRREQDWVGASLRVQTRKLEEYRQARAAVSVQLEQPSVRKLAAALHPGEALALLGLSYQGLLIVVVCAGDENEPSGQFFLDEWPEKRIVQTLAGENMDGWIMALGGRVWPPLDPREPLEHILRDMDEPIGTTLGKFAHEHDIQHLTIMPDPWLDFVPLWALPGLDGLDVSMASSPSQFVEKRNADPLRFEGALVVSDPTGDLPASIAEGAAVRRRLSDLGIRVSNLTRDEATQTGVVDALSCADLFHFSGHGRSVLSAPLQSALELHPDWSETPLDGPQAFLELGDRDDVAWEQPVTEQREALVAGIGRIRELSETEAGTFQHWLDYKDRGTLWGRSRERTWLRVSELWSAGDMMVEESVSSTRLAFLSACSSGGAFTPSFDGASGLVAALQLAGVSTVVSARWQVDDALTALFVDRFYERLGRDNDGASITRILRDTSNTLRKISRDEAINRIAAIVKETNDRRARFALRVFSSKLADADDYPFEHPYHWAAFYVSGAGTLRAQVS